MRAISWTAVAAVAALAGTAIRVLTADERAAHDARAARQHDAFDEQRTAPTPTGTRRILTTTPRPGQETQP